MVPIQAEPNYQTAVIKKRIRKPTKPFEPISPSIPLSTSPIIEETIDEVLRDNVLNDVYDHSLQPRPIEREHYATRTQRDKEQQELIQELLKINKVQSEDNRMLLSRIRELNVEREEQKINSSNSLSESGPRSLNHQNFLIINFVNRQLVNFNGRSDENYNSWVTNVKMILEQYPQLTEKEKITIVLTKLGETARQIAEQSGRISVSDIILSLNRAYTRKHLALLGQTKQDIDENVQDFANRLQENLIEAKINSEEVVLNYFLNGLESNLKIQVTNAAPNTFEYAVDTAIRSFEWS